MNQPVGKTFLVKWRRSIAAVAVVLVAPMATPPAAADEGAGQVWLISTRRAPPCGWVDAAGERIGYWRLQGESQWERAEEDDFLDGNDRSLPTTIFVHGNRVDRHGAIQNAWPVYRQIKQDSDGRPFRFVVWSWPSGQILRRVRRDVQMKADYCDGQSHYLAECLADVDPNVPISLIGYSFGARVITGALHLLAGGQVAGRSLPERPAPEQRPVRRAILVAAALDADWLVPGHCHGLALSEVERMLITRNYCDPVLKWYPRMYGRGGSHALGFAGPAGGESSEKIELLDVSLSVGRAHDRISYLQAPELRRRMAYCTFLDEE